MNIERMHYEFLLKFNKVSSDQNKSFLIPEIDLLLNEAQEIFVKRIVMPKYNPLAGVDKSQRNIDDVRTLVVSRECKVKNNNVTLPDDYLSYINSTVTVCGCGNKPVTCQVFIQQHQDMFQSSSFDSSSVQWREINATFDINGIKLYPDGDSQWKGFMLTYVKRPVFITNGWNSGSKHGYKIPGSDRLTGCVYDSSGNIVKDSAGIPLNGNVNCELPESTHSDIVDLAVMIASGNLASPEYQFKLQKLQLSQII